VLRVSDLPVPTSYASLDFNAPLSDARAETIARALAGAEPSTILDIGCGWGELLLRVVAATSEGRGRGIDSDPAVLERGRVNAASRGLADRVVFVEGPVPTEHEPADVVICIGADHAWGSQADALGALHGFVRPGGQLLFGSGFWERPPSVDEAATLDMTPDSLPDLAALVDLAIAAGYRPLFVETANRDEWERFESGYLADWERWLHRYDDEPGASEIRAKADAHRNQWLRGYRHLLGFAYLTLGR
jgi:ubiquinone/menaquinone biosynthesis C-methylase UbiE